MTSSLWFDSPMSVNIRHFPICLALSHYVRCMSDPDATELWNLYPDWAGCRWLNPPKESPNELLRKIPCTFFTLAGDFIVRMRFKVQVWSCHPHKKLLIDTYQRKKSDEEWHRNIWRRKCEQPNTSNFSWVLPRGQKNMKKRKKDEKNLEGLFQIFP